MIAGLIGNVYSKSGNSVLFNVGGVIYEVFMSINALSNLKDSDTLLITQIVREDGIFLYGFLQKSEKDLFDTLIKINGIGPKVAMAICSSFAPSEFISIAYNNDFTSLKKVPGIGEKMAKRIIVEISGKLEVIDSTSIPQHKKDAITALESLGFKRNDFMKIIENSTHSNTQDIIKEALKNLSS